MATRAAAKPELAAFLHAMRARRQPHEVGLPDTGRRRTPGLRRQEVAQLASLSVEWYIRLEQGRVGAPGSAVLDAISEALRLTETERHHLHLLARGEAPPPRHVRAPVADSLLRLLGGMPTTPAWVVDVGFDVLAANDAARALFGPDFGACVNTAEQMFLSPEMRRAQLDWERIARKTVGNLRAELARHPDDARLRSLIGDLQQRSAEFAAWWDDHSVQERISGTKRLRHPVGGDLTLAYDVLAVQDGSGHRLFAITAVDAASEVALRTVVAHGTSLRVVGRAPAG